MKHIISFLLFLTISSLSVHATKIDLPTKALNKVVGVRLTDVSKFYPRLLPHFRSVTEKVTKNLSRYLDIGEKVSKVYNIYFRDLPEQAPLVVLPLTAFVETAKGQHLFIDFDLTYQDRNNITAELKREYSLQDTKFKLQLALASRKLILTDETHGAKMVVPVGVGAFDENVLNNATTLLTPRYKNAFIDKSAAIEKRSRPKYYANKPFIRFTTDVNVSKGHTPEGFHAQPNLDTFIRAFDSHGCVRLQLFDLDMLYHLLASGPHQRLNLNISFNVDDKMDHPFPLRNTPYKSVINTGSKEKPNYTMDRDGLVGVRYVSKSAPVAKLYDRVEDNGEQFYNYTMAWREKERVLRIRKSCKESSGLNSLIKRVNAKNYVVKWGDFKPSYPMFSTPKQEQKLLRRAKKTFKKAKKKMAKSLAKARKQNRKEYDSQKKKATKEYQSCTKKISRHRGLRNNLYRWWVH